MSLGHHQATVRRVVVAPGRTARAGRGAGEPRRGHPQSRLRSGAVPGLVASPPQVPHGVLVARCWGMGAGGAGRDVASVCKAGSRPGRHEWGAQKWTGHVALVRRLRGRIGAETGAVGSGDRRAACRRRARGSSLQYKSRTSARYPLGA